LDWDGGFAAVAACAAFLLLAAGGFVTGTDEGLAVVDWPNTEGYNMFLYPLSRMTGGVYLEHAHRLLGTLVGLSTLVLAVHLQFTERRAWLKALVWLALAMVIVQGVLGGLRVTGRFTLSTQAEDTDPSVILAIVHGVFGQLVFAGLVAVAVFRSRAWREAGDPTEAPGVSTDRILAALLVAVLVGQLVLGALVRHFTWALSVLRYGLETPPESLIDVGRWALHLHITVAVVVAMLAVAVGIRAWGLYQHVGVLSRLGVAILLLTAVQLTLGITALVVTGDDSPQRRPQAVDVAITTAHQVVGAALLAGAVMILLWSTRRLTTRLSPLAIHSVEGLGTTDDP
jgi:cytochrome c oxidase assembly protein subunit 15